MPKKIAKIARPTPAEFLNCKSLLVEVRAAAKAIKIRAKIKKEIRLAAFGRLGAFVVSSDLGWMEVPQFAQNLVLF